MKSAAVKSDFYRSISATSELAMFIYVCPIVNAIIFWNLRKDGTYMRGFMCLVVLNGTKSAQQKKEVLSLNDKSFFIKIESYLKDLYCFYVIDSDVSHLYIAVSAATENSTAATTLNTITRGLSEEEKSIQYLKAFNTSLVVELALSKMICTVEAIIMIISLFIFKFTFAPVSITIR